MPGQDLISLVQPDPARDRARVDQGFLPKLGRVLGYVPFVDDALAAYYCARDPKTPARARAALMAALAYFVVPTDLVPDFIAALGFTDDASVLLAAVQLFSPHISEDHRARAKDTLKRLSDGT